MVTAHPDGSAASHLREPLYHRDPRTGESFLRYRVFGWKILDELRAAGFSRANATYFFAPVLGYMSLHPLIIAQK